MISQIPQTYTGADASIEIAIMLGVMLVLGYILGRLTAPKNTRIITGNAAAIAVSESVKTSQKKPRKKQKNDDLSVIEGIGPKTVKHLEKHGVKSFEDILSQDIIGLEEILAQGGVGIKGTSPATWPDQARLAQEEKWTELEEYQSILNGRKKDLLK